ncbi:hypothetical protein [Yeosuana marina]|uniref:hypothetical protein n=1 Tax=Yeosuana marina TaxID=1565536 RepID=UPI0030C8288B
MKRFLVVIFLITCQIQSQNSMESKLPYYEIPDTPESYTAGTVAARMLDGLGFRYYWATEGLQPEDLSFKPSDDARTSAETIDHIYILSKVILNATLQQSNEGVNDIPDLTFNEKRRQTLENIKTAADILRASDDISQFKLIFSEREFPFRNSINGPIEDAVWHCGQIVSFRRSSGNPYNSKANVFTGKVRE